MIPVAALSSLLAQVETIVQRAGEIARLSRNNLEREIKPDGSIVTNGDRAVESFLRTELQMALPGSEVWGEEYGFGEDQGSGLWLVDPIDGTSNYAFGSPLWGISIGLLCDRELQLGAVVLPDLGETYLSEQGGGVTRNGDVLPKIPPGPIRNEELVSYGRKVAKLCPNLPGKMRCSGAFVIDGSFVACQRLRGLIGFREKLYDVSACILFGLELGADVRYADGEPFRIEEHLCDRSIDRPWMIFPADSGYQCAS